MCAARNRGEGGGLGDLRVGVGCVAFSTRVAVSALRLSSVGRKCIHVCFETCRARGVGEAVCAVEWYPCTTPPQPCLPRS